MKFFYLFFLSLFLSNTSLADPVTSFDDFDWGSSRNDIIQVRGEPSYLGDESMFYINPGDEVGGYGVETLYYVFKEGCSKLKESISQPCYLWMGTYRLLTKSENEFQKLIEILSDIYGDPFKEVTAKDENDYYTKEFIAKDIFTEYSFKQSDGSSVVLYKNEYDRDFFNKLMDRNYYQGIQNIYVSYRSPEYNEIQDQIKQSKNKKKEF